jgi:hypothetical protein
MKHVAGFVQLLGLVLVPAGLFMGISSGNTSLELTFLGIGGGVFLLGKYVLEPRSTK